MASFCYFMEVISAVLIALTLTLFVPCIRSALRRTSRPRVFPWIIWESMTLVVFSA